MIAFVWVMLGGALGSALRFGVGRIIPFSSASFPWATLCVNLIGSLLIGLLAGYVHKRGPDSESLQWFLMSGFCGGFTTFSAFSLETLSLIQLEKWSLAITYILVSVLLGIGATWIGWTLLRAQ